jgi:gliding motility-associated-like protein
MNASKILFHLLLAGIWFKFSPERYHQDAPPPRLAHLQARCDGRLGPDLLGDGDFGAGEDNVLPEDPEFNVGVDYTTTTPPAPGEYTIANSTASWEGVALNWINTGDNSEDPNGYMLAVNLPETEPAVFYQRELAVCGATTYEFSADLINLAAPGFSPVSPSIVEFLVDGESLGDTGELPQDGEWNTYGFTFTTLPDQSAIVIALMSAAPGDEVNAIALDNVLLRPCGPDITLSEVNAQPRCAGDPLELALTVGPEFPTPFVQWQFSINEGAQWVNVGAIGTNLNLTVPTLPPNALFRALVGNSEDQLLEGDCYVLSDTLSFTYRPAEECFTIPVTVVGDLCEGALGANTVADGDFGSGEEPFGDPLEQGLTTYVYVGADTFPREGQYTIAQMFEADPCLDTLPEPCWIPAADQSDSLGYVMIVNGTSDPGIIFTQVVEDLCEDIVYQFSIDVLNLANPDGPAPDVAPNLDLVIASAGTPLAALLDVPAVFNTGDIDNNGEWRTFGLTFTLNPGVSGFIVAVRNNAAGEGLGNDFALDNVTVAVCGPPSILTREEVCPGENVTLAATLLGDQFPNPALQWIRSLDGGESWEEIPGQTGLTLPLTPPIEGALYTLLIADNPSHLQQPNCRINSPVDVFAFLPTYDLSIDTAVCTGQVVMVGDQIYNTPGIYTQTLRTQQGCDSIVRLTLNVVETFFTDLDLTVCQGAEVRIGDEVFTESGAYSITLVATGGCDSIVNLRLEVVGQIETFQEVALCPGETFNGIRPAQDSTIVEVFELDNGCDSVATTFVRVSTLEGFAISGPGSLCAGPATLSVGAAQGSFLWSTGAAGPSITVSEPGLYSVVATDELGCSAEAEIEVVDSAPITVEIEVETPICAGDANGGIVVSSISGGVGNFTYSLNGGIFQSTPIFSNLTAGVYELVVRDDAGCELRQSIALDDPPVFSVDLGEDITLARGDSVLLSPKLSRPAVSLEWTPTQGLSCADCLEPFARPLQTTSYTLAAFDENGCRAADQILIRVDLVSRLFIPNAFSPNGDNINDRFVIFAASEVQQIDRLLIFDRWGTQVFFAQNFAPNDESFGWDGLHRGQPCAPGVYVYFAEVSFIDGRTELFRGDVTLVR